MGREIRMVPANWEHPQKDVMDYRTGRLIQRYQPLYDQPYKEAINEWIEEKNKWERGEHPEMVLLIWGNNIIEGEKHVPM